MVVKENPIAVYNEWGQLREAFVGIIDDVIDPEYIPALAWMTEEWIENSKKYGGKPAKETFPELLKMARDQVDGHARNLKNFGVRVHRNISLKHEEEIHYMDSVQRGKLYSGGADFFRVIGNNLILLNNMRYPFRRKQVWTVRPVLDPLVKGRNVRYISLPPCSPHYTEHDIYLENGDIEVDGCNVYVGMSGLATSIEGRDWLAQYLGPEYRIYTIPLAANVLHLDTVMMLNRPGLLTYYPDLVKELPKPLQHWDKIKVYQEKEDTVSFGANSISLDENTIIISEEYKRLKPEYEKRGMEVITEPMSISMLYGSGPRCLTGVLSRDP